MLRFLNSPVPTLAQPLSSLSSTTNNTPSLSPVSETSALMTPTDLSPVTGFDKLNCHFDFDQSMPPNQSLLFETSPSRLHAPSLSPAYKSFYAEHGGARGYNAMSLPYVDPFSNRGSSTYLPQNLSRVTESNRSRNGPHIVGGMDWLRPEEKVPGEVPSLVGTRTLSVPPFPAVQPAALAHEVRIGVLHQNFRAPELVRDHS